ncbi:MAG: electron transfer flavoprotein subunit beta/FixA family protein [Acidobacteriota bacterium]|nr:electron transfer flavoprotein subunit beta/FixA family protein [Acidobacteriota bacterium]
MRTLVCMKQILDPDLPARDFQVDADAREAKRGSANLVTNIFCENALETALQLRKSAGGEITALCYGGEHAEDVLRKALAMTADHAVLVSRSEGGTSNPDPATVARVLAAAIRQTGEFDLVLVGRESGDWGVGQTGGLLAEELDMPCLSLVDDIQAEGGELTVRRQTDIGFEVAKGPGPAVLTITNNEANVPRIPKTRDVMMSYRKPLTTLALADLGLDDDEVKAAASYYEVSELYLPTKEVDCEFAEGDTVEEKVDAFAGRLAEVVNSVG